MNDKYKIIRIDTGISGLNDILNGGLPACQMYLIEGNPGTGKTTLAMQFILAGIHKGEKALYITLSESQAELEGSARSHGWEPSELPIAEFIPAEANLSPDQQYTVFHPSEVELADTIQKLTQIIDDVQPDRLVIDSLSELRLLAADPMRYRRQLLALKHFLLAAIPPYFCWMIAPQKAATCSCKALPTVLFDWRRLLGPMASHGVKSKS